MSGRSVERDQPRTHPTPCTLRITAQRVRGQGKEWVVMAERSVPVRRSRLTLPEVQALVAALLSQPAIGEADLLAFARQVNGGDFRDAPAAKPKSPKGPSLAEIKKQVLAHFQCNTLAALKKNHNFQLAMTGETMAFKSKDDWLKLYRRFIGIPPNERNLASGPTVINGIDVLKHFRPWVVFGLDPKTATADDVRSAFRRLIQQHHPDHGGDPRVAERLQTMKDSILALMPS